MPTTFAKKNTKKKKTFDDELAEPYAVTDTAVETRPIPFAELGVPAPLLRVLAADDKTIAFPIQADTLPDSLNGRDILGRGRTGSGKTLAFCIPLAARLCEAAWEPNMSMAEYRRNIKHIRRLHLEERTDNDFMPHPRGLVLAPTRELANQINDVLEPLAQMAGMTTTTVYGGVRYNRQIRDLKAGADIVVACPGRLEDLLRQQALVLSDVRVVVLDEADEMADMGFLEPVRRILAQIRPDAQHMLFSATLDHGIDQVVRDFLHNPKVHSVAEPENAADTMEQHVFDIDKNDKNAIVHALASGKGRRILFTRTKYQAKNLAKKLTQSGIPASELHGNLSQNQRDRNLAAFEQGDVNVMVATDVAARGIDVSDVELVVQVDPPADPKSFVHRSGRTARAGKSGVVVTLVTPDQRREARRMLKAAGIDVKPVKVRHDSAEVLELVGERAELVEGWSLDLTQPAGNPRERAKRGTHGGRRADRGKALKHLPADMEVDLAPGESPEKRAIRLEHERNAMKKERRRRRAAERAERAAAQAATPRNDSSHDDVATAPVAHRTVTNHVERDNKANKADDRSLSPRRSSSRQGQPSGKRIHRRDENRIIVDERGEAVKRHERRMIAKYGNADGPHRRHSKVQRAPFRIGR